MKEISEITAFTNELEIVRLPQSRIIGRAIRNGGAIGNTAPQKWDEVFATDDHSILAALPQVVGKGLFGWTLEYDQPTDTFIYIVCALTPAGTAVPEGFDYRDIPETLCAIGLYGESVRQTLDKAAPLGYEANWNREGCGWNAELYFDEEETNPPKQSKTPWHWLVPIRAV